jgi:hypothetical protein
MLLLKIITNAIKIFQNIYSRCQNIVHWQKINLIKKTNQKDVIKMVMSIFICPKMHFGQIEHGDNWDII